MNVSGKVLRRVYDALYETPELSGVWLLLHRELFRSGEPFYARSEDDWIEKECE